MMQRAMTIGAALAALGLSGCAQTGQASLAESTTSALEPCAAPSSGTARAGETSDAGNVVGRSGTSRACETDNERSRDRR